MQGGAREFLAQSLEVLAVAAVLALLIMAFVAQSFVVQGYSMEPTLYDGERLLVDKISYRLRDPARGEIVVFRVPTDPSRKFVKRIVGIPGDVVEFRGGTVYLNGKALQEQYARGPTQSRFAREVVPPGRYFVLGDNRTNSDDSRFDDVGLIPREAVIGRAVVVFWPLHRAALVQVPPTLASAGP